MPFTVSINIGARPVPQVVAPTEVVRRARASGSTNAARALAVTLPTLRIDQRGLLYAQRLNSGRVEFSFDTGTLRLTLRQEIFIANDIPACAQGVWISHENGHVTDNQRLMGGMERAIRRESRLQPIFFSPRWYPRASFSNIENTIETTVGNIFRTMVAANNRARDTAAEYRRVNRAILAACPVHYHEVERSQTLSWIAQYYYGNARYWPSIYRANQHTIGKNPDLIYPGQQLLIPKNP